MLKPLPIITQPRVRQTPMARIVTVVRPMLPKAIVIKVDISTSRLRTRWGNYNPGSIQKDKSDIARPILST